MGFRTGSFCKVWEVSSISDTMTKARVSISRKDRNTDQYVQDFGGFIVFVGTQAAQKGLRLQPGDTIKLGDVDVSNRYDKVKRVEYTDFKVFSFEGPDELGDGHGRQQDPMQTSPDLEFMKIEEGFDGETVPF